MISYPITRYKYFEYASNIFINNCYRAVDPNNLSLEVIRSLLIRVSIEYWVYTDRHMWQQIPEADVFDTKL